MFTIRKNSKWTSVSRGSVYGCLIFLMIGCNWGILAFLYQYYTWGDINSLVPCLFLWIFFVILLLIFRWESKIKKGRDLKNNWNWILKRLPVTDIWHYTSQGDSDSTWFSWYYLEIKDWDMIYCSDWFENAKKEWLSKEQYKAIYNKYWFDYDEKYKQNILDKIDEELSSVEDQMKHSWFLKKWFIKNVTYRVLKDIRIIIEKWYTPGKMIVNWKTVSIWDLVDIYIDPNDNTIYHVDIDFLTRK